MPKLTRIASILLVLFLTIAVFIDFGAISGVAGMATADSYYEPLQKLIPDEAQRRAVEDSIIKTHIHMLANRRNVWFVLHSVALIGAIFTCRQILVAKSR